MAPDNHTLRDLIKCPDSKLSAPPSKDSSPAPYRHVAGGAQIRSRTLHDREDFSNALLVYRCILVFPAYSHQPISQLLHFL